MKKVIALEFGTNMFGKLKPEIKKRLQAVIDNPCAETWDDAHSIILNASGKVTTLWQAVLLVDPTFQRSAGYNMDDHTTKWKTIPSQETIIEAINNAILKDVGRKNLN